PRTPLRALRRRPPPREATLRPPRHRCRGLAATCRRPETTLLPVRYRLRRRDPRLRPRARARQVVLVLVRVSCACSWPWPWHDRERREAWALHPVVALQPDARAALRIRDVLDVHDSRSTANRAVFDIGLVLAAPLIQEHRA